MSQFKNNIIPLDKFIDASMYNSKNGYYMNSNPFGNKGDFITSPNISILFSEMIFVWIYSFWEYFGKPKKLNIVDLGGGNGEMIYRILVTASKFKIFLESCNFYIFEKSPYLKKIQQKKISNKNVVWLDNFNRIPKVPTLFIGNEFFDALPIKQFEKKNAKWYEKYVKKNTKNINFDYKKIDIKKIEKKIGFKISKGQKFIEFSPLGFELLKSMCGMINKYNGGLLIIDYGFMKHKMKDTIQAVKKHKKVDFLKEHINVDISYLVNFNLIKSIIEKFNLNMIGFSSQRKFLINLGILHRAEILSKNLLFSEKANIYSRLTRLIDKKQMGELFKVAFISKKINNKFRLGFK
mgnify:CR=1 FL=1